MRKITLFALALFAGFGAQAQGCDELFFSEYAEGASQNKYYEIYNQLQIRFPFRDILFQYSTMVAPMLEIQLRSRLLLQLHLMMYMS